MTKTETNPYKNVAAYYEQLSEDYLEVWGARLHHGLWTSGRESVEEALEAMEERILGAAEIPPASRVIDVGCGFGALACRLARDCEAEVSGWTLSSFQVDHARASALNLSGVSFHGEDWLTSPDSIAAIDRILAVESLSHLEDPEAFFAKAVKSLRETGRIVIADWFAAADQSGVARQCLLDPISRAGRLAPFRTIAAIEEVARNHGFRMESIDHLGPGVRRTWSMIAKRFLGRFMADRSFRRRWLKVDRLRRAPGFALTVLRLQIAYVIPVIDYAILTLVWEDEVVTGSSSR